MHLFSTPENIREPYGFLMFSVCRGKGALGTDALKEIRFKKMANLNKKKFHINQF